MSVRTACTTRTFCCRAQDICPAPTVVNTSVFRLPQVTLKHVSNYWMYYEAALQPWVHYVPVGQYDAKDILPVSFLWSRNALCRMFQLGIVVNSWRHGQTCTIWVVMPHMRCVSPVPVVIRTQSNTDDGHMFPHR